MGSIPAILVILLPKLHLHFFKKKQNKTNLKSINFLNQSFKTEGKKSSAMKHISYKLFTKKPTLFKLRILKKQIVKQHSFNSIIRKNTQDILTFK